VKRNAKEIMRNRNRRTHLRCKGHMQYIGRNLDIYNLSIKIYKMVTIDIVRSTTVNTNILPGSTTMATSPISGQNVSGQESMTYSLLIRESKAMISGQNVPGQE
jgi:hypothetical protein